MINKFWILSIALMACAVKIEANVANPVVKLHTNKGDIFIELFIDKAPISVQNFTDYVQEGFYNGTIFHRVIPGFMNQGGGMLPGLVQKPTKPPIKNEATNGLSNKRGTICMARTSVIDSATSQFFINTADNPFLDHKSDNSTEYGYAVFGKVIDGMKVVDEIAKAPTHRVGPYSDVPVDDIVIEEATLTKGKPKKETKEKTPTKSAEQKVSTKSATTR